MHARVFFSWFLGYFSLGIGKTYAVAGLYGSSVDGLHDTAFFVGDIAHPVCLPRCNKQMRVEPLHMTEQLLSLIDFEFARILDAATGTVMQTVVAINRRVGSREQILRLLDFGKLVGVLADGDFGRRRQR